MADGEVAGPTFKPQVRDRRFCSLPTPRRGAWPHLTDILRANSGLLERKNRLSSAERDLRILLPTESTNEEREVVSEDTWKVELETCCRTGCESVWEKE